MLKKTTAKQNLPKAIYVKREMDENDPDGSYLTASESIDSMDDGDTVGVYELVETKTKRVTHDLK